MARLARLAVPGLVHYLIQRGVDGQPIVRDAIDRRAYLAALHGSAAGLRVAVHAYALLDGEAHLLVTPPDAAALGQLMQRLGRRHVGAFNRRHGRRGALFEGRFRGTVVEPGPFTLAALRWIEGLPARSGPPQAASDPLWGSAAHHLGERRDRSIVDPPEFWQLGNTPFERESAFAALLRQPLSAAEGEAIHRSALLGWAVGSPAFVAALGEQGARPAAPRPRGRKRAGTVHAA